MTFERFITILFYLTGALAFIVFVLVQLGADLVVF